MVSHLDRRRFFTGLAAAGGFAALSPFPALAANAKMQHAAVGVRGMGKADLHNVASHSAVEIVALCDVDAGALKEAAAKFPQARTYRDWREMLEKEGDKIDTVNVTVPDHMHAPIALSAMKRGKHIYCQKPLTHDLNEARQMAEFAARYNCTTQMGNHIHSHIAYRLGVAIIRQGTIGKIREVHSWVNSKYPQPPRPSRTDSVPAELNWDHWLGVAPERPFLKDLYHPFQWRCWQDFGTGAMGDFGCHILDPVFSALDLTAPTQVKAEVPSAWADNTARFKDSWPDWEILHYQFPGTKFTTGETLNVTWYDGGKQPPPELAQLPKGWNLSTSGSLFIGEEGVMMLPHVNGPQLFPQEKFKGKPRPKLEKQIDHYHIWIDSARAGKRTSDGFHYAGPLTEAVLVGTIAARFPSESLHWDAKAMQFPKAAKATALLKRDYRDGWGVI